MSELKVDLSDALKAARSLLGSVLIHESPEGRTSGIIVETEAYTMEDTASHSFGGERGRNWPMYRSAGTIYVYFTYGMHYCFNIVTGPTGHGQAVLVRALEPTEGIELMTKRRGDRPLKELCNGPAKLVQALGITKNQNGTVLNKGSIRLETSQKPSEIIQTTRVGITKAVDMPWRFYIAGNQFVSRK